MVKITEIQNHISKGKTQEALEALKALVDVDYPNLSADVTLLLSEFHQWQRQNRIGLNPDSTEIRRIELAVLEICSEIKNRSGAIEETSRDQSEHSLNKFHIILRQIDVIIEVHKNAIRRSTYLGIALVVMGLSLLGLHPFFFGSGERYFENDPVHCFYRHRQYQRIFDQRHQR